MEASSFTSPEPRPDGVLRALAGAGYAVGSWEPIGRTVLDTFDGRLHAAGLRLELRDGPRRHLVLTGGGAAAARVSVPAAPRVAADLPVGPFRARLAPVLDVRALLPVIAVTGRRADAIGEDGDGKRQIVVAVYDGLRVDGAGSAAPAWAVEVEELVGYEKAAEKARRLLHGCGLQPHPGDVVDLLGAAAGVDFRGYSGSPTVALDRDQPALPAVCRVLANLADAVAANWAGTVDDVDPEFLHELRVAVRRTRSVLSQARRVLPDAVRDRYREEFGWLGLATGPARDLDVYVIEWPEYVAPLHADSIAALEPLHRHIDTLRAAEHATLADTLRSARYREVMDGWRALLAAPLAADAPPGGRDAARPIGRVAASRIGDAQRRLVTQGRAIGPASPAEDLHALRKDGKRLRYLVECFGGVLDPGPRKAFVQRLKALQDNLGEFQDTEVHAAQLRAFSKDLFDAPGAVPETLVAMGQLAERFELRRQAARDEFARRFASYDSEETERTLDALLASARAKAAPAP